MSGPGGFPTPPSRRATYQPVSNSQQPTSPTSPSRLPKSPTDPYANLSGASLSPHNYLSPSPDMPETSQLLGRDSIHMPAPSIISRNSSIPGTPSLDDQPGSRASWGSGAALGAGAAAFAGQARTPSGLRATPLSGSRLSVSDEDDEGQGHITPAVAAVGTTSPGNEKPAWASDPERDGRDKKSRKWLWILVGAGALLLAVGLGVGLGIGLTQNKSSKSGSTSGNTGDASNPSSTGSSGSGGASASPSASAAPAAPTTGTSGSTVTLEDGSTMVYNNPHGGKWVWDPKNPFNNEAQAQTWTPPLNQNWTFGRNKIYGVGLGGWLNTEPFLNTGLYEQYATGPAGTAVDEYTLMQNMGTNMNSIMDNHYATFVTERDFIEMVAAGINWIRLPFGHWAIETLPGEPYYEKKSWEYVLLAIKWCRKYGLRINLDLHTVPGSQNGWNHSGRLGSINWMNGVMGLANAQRSLDYIRSVTQFISQPEYLPVIPMWGFINEPNAINIGKQRVGTFYLRAYNEARSITGIGEGKGPMLSIHDGFLGITSWYDFLPGADRLALDQHPYMVFGDQQTGTLDDIATLACNMWALQTNNTYQQYGMVTAGEWSAAINDCGQWVNAVGAGSRYAGTYTGYTGPTGGSCSQWNDWRTWTPATISGLRSVVLAEMDALQDWFFWTWTISNSTGSIPEPNPFWNYKLGLRQGWIPSDPREAIGTCIRRGISANPFSGTFSSAYMTGGPGAGTIAAAQTASYTWPPVSFNNIASAQMQSLPQYTQTGTPITMPAPTFTSPGQADATINAGNGWFNPSNSRGRYVPIANCAYPNEYSAADLQPTAGMCGAGIRQPTPRAAMPEPTAPPSY